MERILFDNIYYKLNNTIMIMNLYSFRRRILSDTEFKILDSCFYKYKNSIEYSDEGRNFITILNKEKQILDKAIIDQYNQSVENNIEVYDSPVIKQITINITHVCNFDCIYCYQKNYSNRTEQITLKHVDGIYKFLHEFFLEKDEEFKLDKVTISGGETLLRRNIQVINKILSMFGEITKSFMLFTNGVNIINYKDDIDFSKFNEVQVSFDGLNNVIRSVNNYVGIDNPSNEISEGIKYLDKLNIQTSVVTMAIPDKLCDFAKFVAFLKEKNMFNLKHVSYRVSFIYDYKGETRIDRRFYNYDSYLVVRKKIQEIVSDLPISIDSLYDLAPLKKIILRDKNTRPTLKVSSCNVNGVIPLLFGPNGKIYWCMCMDPKYGIVGQYYPNRKFYKKELERLRKRNIFNIEECKKCIFKYLCVGGCVLPLIATNTKLNKPQCGVFKNKKVMSNLEKYIF